MKNSVTENYLQELQKEKIEEVGLVTASIAASLALTAYNFYKDNIAKASKYCADFKSQEKTKCLLGYKIKASQRLMNDLKSGMSRCEDYKCKEKLLKKYKNVEFRLNKMKKQLTMVMQQKY